MSAEDVVYIGVAVFALGIGFLIINFATTTLFNALQNTTEFNVTNTNAGQALQAVEDNVLTKLDYVVTGFFIALVLGLVITSWFIGGNPIFMFIYFIVVVIATVVSAILSNVWEAISTNSNFVGSLTGFQVTNHLLSYLPLYVGVVGVVGIVIMYAKPYLSESEGNI